MQRNGRSQLSPARHSPVVGVANFKYFEINTANLTHQSFRIDPLYLEKIDLNELEIE